MFSVAKAKQQLQSAQPERKSPPRFAEVPIWRLILIDTTIFNQKNIPSNIEGMFLFVKV